MRFVVDASLALKWVMPEADSEAAAKLRHQELIAPSLWLGEVGNALWRHVRLGEIAPEQAFRRLAELANAPVVLMPMEVHVDRALQLAIELGHPIYDCLHLAVALHLEIDVITADRRFAAAVDASPYAGRVKLLGSA